MNEITGLVRRDCDDGALYFHPDGELCLALYVRGLGNLTIHGSRFAMRGNETLAFVASGAWETKLLDGLGATERSRLLAMLGAWSKFKAEPKAKKRAKGSKS